MNKNINKISWLLFDLGGIVVPESGKLLNDEMAAYLKISPLQLSGFTLKYQRRLTMGTLSLLEMYSDIVGELPIPCSPETLLEHHLAFYRRVSTQHNPEVVGIIELLKKSYGLACLTNTEPEIADICRGTGLFDYFHKAFLSIELGMQKPDHEIFEKVAEEIGCAPEEILFVDDKQENVKAAKEVGMQGLLFSDVEHLRKELSACLLKLSS
jgi:putative hydrolase of the HAD superfamily